MTPHRVVLLALFVVGGALVAAVPAGATNDVGAHPHAPSAVGVTDAQHLGVTDAQHLGVTDAQPTANNSTANASLGADISAFMQASAAEVGGAVETGMWTAAFNATGNRSMQVALVERRTGELRSELAALRERKAELVAEREAGNVSETAYKAKISHLLGRINALQSAITATSERAERVNADVEALETLRSETDNLTGPEIAAVARNVTGVGDGNRGVGEGNRGPPADAGDGVGGDAEGSTGNGNAATGEENSTTSPPNDANSPPKDANSPPNDVGNDASNANQRGPPGQHGDSERPASERPASEHPASAGQSASADRRAPADRQASADRPGPPDERENVAVADAAESRTAVGTVNASSPVNSPVAGDGATTAPRPGASRATTPDGLVERTGDATDAATGAVGNALSGIPR